METITLLKLTHRYPDDGPMVKEYVPTATVQGTVELLPGDGLQVTVPFTAQAHRVECRGKRYEVVSASDWLLRRERLIMVLAPAEA